MLQGVLMVLVGLLYGSWTLSLAMATRGDPAATRSLLAFCLVWAFAGNGGSIVLCPPPCEGAVPFGEIAHSGALVCGGVASYATWREIKASRQRPGWTVPLINVALIGATFVLLGTLAGSE